MVFSTMPLLSWGVRRERRSARLVTRPREFNTTARAGATALLLVLGATSHGAADEIRKWRDADGNLHYSVTGSGAGAAEGDEVPVLQGRDLSPEEAFSIRASLRRREIETRLKSAGRSLDETRAELKARESATFSAWVPDATGSSRQAKASLDAQRDALLAMSQFDQEKADALRRLRRREREQLKTIVGLWNEFNALDTEVTEHYGAAPDWWRKRLDCPSCPSLAEAERALRGERATPTPTDAADATGKTAQDDWDDEDDEEGWEKAWE
jgi:hypothetical protein